MTVDRPSPPDPTEATTVADFVKALVQLRQWAGEPSLSRLRTLGGHTLTPDGDTVDALPKSTTSQLLRQTERLPRWDFVKAFVTACLRYCDHPAELIPAEVQRWRTARTTLTEPSTSPAPSTPSEPSAPSTPSEPSEQSQPESAGRPEPDPAVELLARRVAREEDRARKGLLGGHSIAPLSFGPRPEPVDHDTDSAREVIDDLRSISRFFGGLDPRRLLVVGESGAGKTMLAIELVLQLVEPFVAAEGPPLGRAMVPVRLNAARWTSGTPFESWLADQVVQNFGLGPEDATRLVRDRRILPVVDGLDELDPEPVMGPPRRAIGLLNELNRYSDLTGRHPGAVVVTCRADRHAELLAARAGLAGAVRIHLHGLTVARIRTYLAGRWPDGHPCEPHRDGVDAALSGPSGTAVRLALATPWRLMLTVTAVESGADPAELLRAGVDPDPRDGAARIARRLLDSYIPAATGLTPRTAAGTPYRPDQVRRWLRTLAAHLRRQDVAATGMKRPPPGLTAIDIVPHLLWPIGGRRRVRALHCLCCLVLAVIAMLAFWTGSAVDEPGDLRDRISLGEGVTLGLMAAWVGIATGLSLSQWPAAAGGRANVPRARRMVGGLCGALAGAAAGVPGGLAGFALTGGEVFGPGFAVAAGAAGGSVFGTVIGLTAAGRGPERMTVAQAVRAEPVTLLGFGLCGALTGLPPLRLADAGPVPMALGVSGAFLLAFALGVVFRIAIGGWSKDAELAHPREALHRNPLIGVAFGLTGGEAAFLVFVMNQGVVAALVCAVTGGVAFGLAFGAIAWSRTMLGLAVAAARGLLPLRLWAFLDWACEARLLRVSGATYQFRHRELQDLLTPAVRDHRD